MKYVVTKNGPIDRHEPGEDVTNVYAPAVLQRLIKDGYVEEFVKLTPKRKAKTGTVTDAD